MAENHLEKLVAEWYEFQGYFIRRNVKVGPRPRGGYECELDIVAYHPGQNRLVHIEPSLDADSWAEREKRFTKKFEAGEKYIRSLFEGLPLPANIDKIAVFVFANRVNHPTVGGGRVMIADELMTEIFSKLGGLRLESSAIPEQLVILRSFQYVCQYRNAVTKAWG